MARKQLKKKCATSIKVWLTALACLGGLIVIRLRRKANGFPLSWSALVKVSLQRLISVHAVDFGDNVLEGLLDIACVQGRSLNKKQVVFS